MPPGQAGARACGSRLNCAIGAGAATLAALALLLVHLGCEPETRKGQPPPEASKGGPVLLFCANNEGVLAACGCPSNPSGGLAKRQALVEQFRRTRSAVALVDAGDVFPDRKNDIKSATIARVVGQCRYDAIGLGDQEFLLGVETLRRFQRDEKIPFLCANVRDAAGEPVAPAHKVLDVAGLKIGVFAVIADEVYGWPPMEWRPGLKIESPAAAARREVEALKGCDLIVALSHQRIEDTRAFIRDVPGIDVVVSGHDETLILKPEKIGKTILVDTGQAGRVLGALSLGRAKDGTVALQQTLTELSARVPDAKWVMDLYWAYVKEAKDAPPPDWNLTGIPDRFDTSEACGKCHEAELKQWQGTRHARAYESLRKAKRQDDPECVLCHTMGFGRKGGFVSMQATPGLGRVTCQACHVVTSDHDALKIKPDPVINISSRLCMSCHGPVQDPNFDYFVDKPKIQHRKSN